MEDTTLATTSASSPRRAEASSDSAVADKISGVSLWLQKEDATIVLGPEADAAIRRTGPSALATDGSLDVRANDASGAAATVTQTHASNHAVLKIDSPTDDDGRVSYVEFARGGALKWRAGGVSNSPNEFGIGTGNSAAEQKMVITPGGAREANRFNYFAIIEVAVIFIGIFITMQVPLEVLKLKGAELGLVEPWHYFWATGILSSFLDNAPTYLVFFQPAESLTTSGGEGILELTGGGFIRQDLLVAISLGAVFMGANTYIGNGPNFMVKAIAEQEGVKMPSFFGYMFYSCLILIPLFVLVSFFFVN